MKYFIKTFGCASNEADSERIATVLENRGMKPAKSINLADHIVINTCVIRESAENRAYGLLDKLGKRKTEKGNIKIVVTGCLVGIATRDSSGRLMKRLHEKFPMVDEFLHIEEVGFDNPPLRVDKTEAWVPISNGCNNCCTFCVVPFTRGRETSRPYDEIIAECQKLREGKYKKITLVGQNVNSYGADLVHGKSGFTVHDKNIKPVYVKHLGRQRIPTLFPYLLEEIAKLGFNQVDFISSNPWDFSPDLIDVIARNKNITRQIHLPVQSGDNEVLRRMNRWYTREEYLELVKSLRSKIKEIKISTDIIVGFPGESEEQFENTVDLCRKVGFYKAYISEYSDRPMTAAHKIFPDNVSHIEKERRWKVLEKLVFKSHSKITPL